MKQWILPAVAVALGIGGCSAKNETASVTTAPAPAPVEQAKLTPAQELTKYCRVCVVDKGERIQEFFPSRLDTKRGANLYKFCSDDCKNKFDANAKRYALK
ncbi:MAG TPA: hypothetical protein VF719_07745 [Abditibacteriaceae bacterium]|jgi:hypothetical protein